MIIRGLVHIDASILVHDEATTGLFADGEVEEEWFARGANNPPFAMKLQRMGHPAFVPTLSSGCE
jgi:hypothetical protein